MEQSVSFDSSTTALPRNQQEAEPLHSVQHRSEVYSSPRKITLMPRSPHVDLPPLQACQAQADDAGSCPAQTAPGPPGGGGDPHELATMPVLTEHGIIQTAVMPVEDGYAIPVIKYGSGFAVPALSVKSEVVFLSNEEVGARPWWRRFRAQGDSDASTTDPASDSGDRETHVDDHFSNDHSDSGSAPVTAGTSEAALTKLLPKELGVLQWLQRMYREKKMHEVPVEPKKSKLPPRRETPKDPDLVACQELMEWLIKVTRERGYTEENEFADLDVKAFASALKKPKVMAEVARIMRDLQYPGGTHRQFDLNRQAPFDTSVVSLFLYNVPQSTKQLDLLGEVKTRGFHGKLDFLYLPFSKEENKNEGYCILSFVDPRYAQEFFWEFHGSFLKNAAVTSKTLSVSAVGSEIQGFSALREKFFQDKPESEKDPNLDPLFLRPARMMAPPPALAPRENQGWKGKRPQHDSRHPASYAAADFEAANYGVCTHCHTHLHGRDVCQRCGARAVQPSHGRSKTNSRGW